jgi:hypothetical protein
MNCVICLETGGERQNKHFQKCHCVVFYHQHCWQQYKRHFNRCPICRSELKIPYLIASLIVIPILLLVILLVHADYRNNFSSYLLGYVLTLFLKNLTTRELIFLFIHRHDGGFNKLQFVYRLDFKYTFFRYGFICS